MTDSVLKVMNRHLDQLSVEIEAYENEADLWILQGEILNTAGTLCLHICGNLQHFIGAGLGNSGYIRDRDAEFNSRDIPRKELLNRIEETKSIVNSTLRELSDEQIKDDYPIEVFQEPMTTEYFLIHLTSHLGYHLGQINYHRRILSSK